MIFNKKAALNLGISTVVVMVIAMVLIGAGVSFIRTMFGESTEVLTRSMSITDIGLQVTRNEPFVLGQSSIDLTGTDRVQVRAAAFNPRTERANITIFSGGCSDGSIRVISTREEVESAGSLGFLILVERTSSVGEVICSINANISVGSETERPLGAQQVTVKTPAAP